MNEVEELNITQENAIYHDAESILHWLEQGTREDKFKEAFQATPTILQELATEASHRWSIDSAVILAHLLHSLAASCGHSHRLRLGPNGYSCPFSMITCSTQLPPESAYEQLSEPWLSKVRLGIREHQQIGTRKLVAQLRSHEQTKNSPAGLWDPSIQLDLSTKIRETYLLLKPCVIARSPKPEDMLQAIQGSYDSCTLSLNDGLDPVRQLLSQGPKKTVELNRLLSMSWRDRDLPVKGIIPKRGVIHLHWQSTHAAVRQLYWGSQSSWRITPPPVLLIRQDHGHHNIEPFESAAFASWSEILGVTYRIRCSPKNGMVWQLTPEAQCLWQQFKQAITSPSPRLSIHDGTSLQFMGDLVLRISIVLALLHAFTQESDTAPALQVEAENMRQACLIGWWLAHEHHECLQWLKMPLTVDAQDDNVALTSIDTIDDAELEQAILERLTLKGPLTPRELSRSFHDLPAKCRDRVIIGLVKGEKIRQDEDGRLALW